LWDTASHRAAAAWSATPDARVGCRPAGRPNGRRPSGDGACGDRVPAEPLLGLRAGIGSGIDREVLGSGVRGHV